MVLSNRSSSAAQARDVARPLPDISDAGAIAAARATDRAMIGPFRGATPVIDPSAANYARVAGEYRTAGIR